MRKLFSETQKALVNLPPKNDFESEIFSEFDFSAGVLNFEGQEFIFPNGFHVEAFTRWLENDLLSVEINIFSEISSECARCLKPVNLEISGKLMYLYYSRGANEFDDAEFLPVEVDFFGRVLDIMPQIQESIYTLLPTKILCKEDCAGLCPNCGADLNETKCSCEKEITDIRLEALRNFKVE